jgi:hypothetical protein
VARAATASLPLGHQWWGGGAQWAALNVGERGGTVWLGFIGGERACLHRERNPRPLTRSTASGLDRRARRGNPRGPVDNAVRGWWQGQGLHVAWAWTSRASECSQPQEEAASGRREGARTPRWAGRTRGRVGALERGRCCGLPICVVLATFDLD